MHADVTKPYYRGYAYSAAEDPYDEFFPVVLLRYWILDINSECYQMKMEIVEEFTRQGVDYWSSEIPKRALDTIKKLYPDTWQDYIKKY